MEYQTFQIGSICSVTKRTFPTLSTNPGEYPLVVTAEYRRSASTYQLEGPAVCVPLISSTGHGHASLSRVHYQEGKFALANLLVALIPKDVTLCDTKYLYYLLTTKKNEYFVPLMSGTANVSLKIQDIASVEIPLPAIEEQRRIVVQIEKLMAKVEEARGLQREVYEETNASLSSMLYVLFEQLQTLSIPKYPIQRASTIFRGRGPDYLEGSSELAINQKCVRWGGIDVTHAKGVNPLWSSSLPEQYLLKENDLVVNSTGEGTIGRACVVTPDVAGLPFDSHLLVVRTKPDKLLPNFVAYFLRSPTGQSAIDNSKGAKTTQQTELGTKKLGEIVIPFPSFKEQQRVVAYLNGLHTKVDALKRLHAETAAELNALLPSILDKAFKGEL